MDMFNRLKSTVASSVGGLLGNPVTREFEIGRHVASAGPRCLWKIYEGIKRSTKQEVSIFYFEKRHLDRFPRKDREQILEALKKGPTKLTRLRHPNLLIIQHPLEESRDSLAFATEPVFASLANLLGNRENLPNPIPTIIAEHELYEVEIKYGLLQITEALKFLHNDVKLIHGNINPECIILNSNGAWKLSGFDFFIPSSNPPDQAPSFPVREWIDGLSPVAQPDLNYMAPEYVLTASCDTASDLFSLGMLMYSVINKGKTLYDNNESVTTFKQNCAQLKVLNMSILGSLPDGLKEYVKMLLSSTPTIRPDADQLSKIPYFDDVGAMTLQYLDTLFQQENIQKSQFFKGLHKVITTLPKRVVLQRVLPCLCKEFYNPDMIPFVLPNVLLIAEQCTNPEFVKLVLPGLKPVFKLQEPVQILLIFMQKMELLLTKTPNEDIRHHVLPMVYRALEAPAPQIQELCLTILPTFASMIEQSSMKHAIMPRIKKLCLETGRLSTRVGCLVCIGKMMEHMDKWFVLDEVLPMVMQIPSKEPAVLMGILGIIKMAATHKKLGITKDMAAGKVLPFLFPLCIDNGLNLNQFNVFMSVIKHLVQQVETDHRGKLEQLNSMQQEQKTSVEFAQKLEADKNPPADPFAVLEKPKAQQNLKNNEVEEMFQSLGLSNYMESKSEKLTAANAAASGSTDDKAPSSKPTHQPAPAGQSAPVSLTLEEKQRLQKEQEYHAQRKNQQPLKPQSSVASSRKSEPKDLTNSLLDSSINRAASNVSMTKASAHSMPSGQMGSSVFQGGPPVGSTMSGTYGASNKPYSHSTGTSFQGSQGYMGGLQSNTAKPKMDLSAFDSLLDTPSSKPKPKLNQMASHSNNRNPAGQWNSPQAPQQGMMGLQMQNQPMGMMRPQGQFTYGGQGSYRPPNAPVSLTGGVQPTNQNTSSFDPFASLNEPASSKSNQSSSDGLMDFLG